MSKLIGILTLAWFIVVAASAGAWAQSDPCPRFSGNIPVSKTVISADIVVTKCFNPNEGGLMFYYEWKNNTLISFAEIFNSDEFDVEEKNTIEDCKNANGRGELKHESWLTQYGTTISTPVYRCHLMYPLRGQLRPQLIEVHQMFRTFGKGAKFINPSDILKTGVIK